MSEIRDRVNFKLLLILDACKSAKEEEGFDFSPYIKHITDIPELAVVDREAELPSDPFTIRVCCETYARSCRRLLKAGYVKEIK